MSKFLAMVRSFATQDHGAVMAEYALLSVLIAVVCVAVVLSIGEHVRDLMFAKLVAAMESL